MEIFGFKLVPSVLLLGAITGMTYGIMAVGLVLTYRASRIVNFAHGNIGLFGASMLGVLVVDQGLPYWLIFPLAITISAALGAATEVAVVRRLRAAPRLMSVIATLGVGQFLLLFSSMVSRQTRPGGIFPQAPGLPSFAVEALQVTPAYSGMLIFSPLIVLALALFLTRSRYGVAIRASASNPDAATLMGIPTGRMSSMAWSLAGAISAFTAILVLPTRGFLVGDTFGPGILLRALVAAVVARMTSFPVALASGLGIGVIEQELLYNQPKGGLVEMLLFVILLITLFLQPRIQGRQQEPEGWGVLKPWDPLPKRLLVSWPARNLGKIIAWAAGAVAIAMPLLVNNATSVILTSIICFGIVGLSIGVVTGLGGQISLGQFALAGIGAAAGLHLVSMTDNYLVGLAGAGLAAAAVSILIALPALRIRGLMVAVSTLAFALATQAWILDQQFLLGEGFRPGTPVLNGALAFDNGKSYYVFAFLILLVSLWLASHAWRGGIRRRLVAVRDNEDSARAFTISALTVRLQAFTFSGFLAGLGGAVFAFSLPLVQGSAFPASASVDVLAITIIGGIGFLVAPLVGALYVIGIPNLLPVDTAVLAGQAAGWLVLILYFPGGLVQMVRPLRDRIIARLAKSVNVSSASGEDVQIEADALLAWASRRPSSSTRNIQTETTKAAQTEGVILNVTGLSKQFGGLTAVDDVSLEVRIGETVGIIGPNGAGKTTLFDLVSGFTRPDTGTISFGGRRIERQSPEAIGRLGLIRSFQEARLFPTLSVLEVVQLAHEKINPTGYLAGLAGDTRNDRETREASGELLSLMGLDEYASTPIGRLSTGTRRITELACMIALRPTLLFLDEPSAGIAQRETEALGELLPWLKEYLEVTLVVIEHDMPLILGLAGRIVVMESGRVIADGTPEAVVANPDVIEAYLGGDTRTIKRSGPVAVGASR